MHGMGKKLVNKRGYLDMPWKLFIVFGPFLC